MHNHKYKAVLQCLLKFEACAFSSVALMAATLQMSCNVHRNCCNNRYDQVAPACVVAVVAVVSAVSGLTMLKYKTHKSVLSCRTLRVFGVDSEKLLLVSVYIF